MGKYRKFTNEFKLEAVRLVEASGKPRVQIARELGLCGSVLDRWVKQFGRQPDGSRMTPEEREELIRLRRDLARITMERDILKKAVGIFSKELP
jgi:transposase-like protein